MKAHPSRRQALAAGLAAGALPLSAQPSAQDSAEKKVRIGLVGLGGRARRHVASIEEVSGVEITALCDIQSDRMASVNDGLGGRATTYVDYRELVTDKNVDVVVIAAPNFLHAPVALAALRAGKDVLVEKPIGLNYEQARQVQLEAERLGRIVAVGMQRRYYSGDKAFSEIVHSGRIGKVQFVSQTEFRGDWNPRTWIYTDPATGKRTPWRHLKETTGSTLLEFSVHSYAFIYGLINSPVVKVSATGGAVKYPQRTTRDVVAVNAEREMYKDFLESVRTRKPSALNPAFAIEVSKIAYAADISIEENRIVTAKDFA